MAQFQSYNPADNSLVWEGEQYSKEQVIHAVQTARNSFDKWVILELSDRIKYLKAVSKIIKSKELEFATTISQEMGKPLWESKQEVQAMIGKFKISIEAYESRCPHITNKKNNNTQILSHKAHGVLAIFGPFNFPGHLPNGHIVPALLAGNTVVFKPSELTPKVGELLFQCYQAADIPTGVINIVQGGKETGIALSQAKDIDGVLFTGSFKVGSSLNNYFATHPGKILALEMGGNNPLVVWDVENTKAAAYHIVQSAFLTSGQRCTCARRLIIPDNEHGEKILEDLHGLVSNIIVGNFASNPQPFMGPVIHQQQLIDILKFQDYLISNGAKSLLAAEQMDIKGAFISPAILDVSSANSIPDTEIFGPLLQVYRVKNFDEAVKRANQTEYGLSAGLIADDKQLFKIFFNTIRAGLINFNTSTTGASSAYPFGGIGNSGNFRPSAYYAADYCAYPVVSVVQDNLELPEKLMPGLRL